MLEKLMMHAVASQLTQAVMATVAETDPMKRQILAVQVQVNFYEWVKQTLVDPAWPIPVIDGSWLSRAIQGQPTPAPAPVPVAAPGAIPAGIAPAIAALVSKSMLGDATFQRMLKCSPQNPLGN